MRAARIRGIRIAAAVAFLVAALAAWVGAAVCLWHARRPFAQWERPLVERGEIPRSAGVLVHPDVWRRLYGSQPEASPEAEALRLRARHWHRRFLAFGLAFAAFAGLSVFVDRI